MKPTMHPFMVLEALKEHTCRAAQRSNILDLHQVFKGQAVHVFAYSDYCSDFERLRHFMKK